MKDYQIQALLKVFLIYIISFTPTWIILFNKKTYENKHNFIKRNSLILVFEIFIFFLIYTFPENIVKLFSTKTNIQNYMSYALKILFISSPLSIFHFTIPLFFYLNQKKSGIYLYFLKLFYIPVIFIFYKIFNIKGALFSIPLCDFILTLFYLYKYKKSNDD